MSVSVSLIAALCLEAPDIEALGQGKTITALLPSFLVGVQQFALCPVDSSNLGKTTLQFWARLEGCKIYNSSEDLEALSRITAWNNKVLQERLQSRSKVFVACFRVYKLSQVVELPTERLSSIQPGKLIRLPGPYSATNDLPVLNDLTFKRRKNQLENLLPPLYPELEKLHSKLAQLSSVDSAVEKLKQDISTFLGWARQPFKNHHAQWIKTIVSLGDRSIEEENQRKSNYQAGTDFENVVRQSLEFLGFHVDEAYKGGAGGLDLFCSEPYPLTGECKAGRKIPSGTIEELIKLGGMHLNPDSFLKSAKLVIGPGNPTSDVLMAAQNWRVSIMNPQSLQQLVELHAKYPNSINLVALKDYLLPGQIDNKINEYIKNTLNEIRLRSQIVKSVNEILDPSLDYKDCAVGEVRAHHNAKYQPKLTDDQVKEFLIELSSPLAGYLGRRKDDRGNDRFYFLRDLIVD